MFFLRWCLFCAPRLLTFYAINIVVAVVFIAFVRSKTHSLHFSAISFFSSLAVVLLTVRLVRFGVNGRHQEISLTENLALGLAIQFYILVTNKCQPGWKV